MSALKLNIQNWKRRKSASKISIVYIVLERRDDDRVENFPEQLYDLLALEMHKAMPIRQQLATNKQNNRLNRGFLLPQSAYLEDYPRPHSN